MEAKNVYRTRVVVFECKRFVGFGGEEVARKHWTRIPFPFLWLQRSDVLVLPLIHFMAGFFPVAYAAILSHGVSGMKLCVPCEVVTTL